MAWRAMLAALRFVGVLLVLNGCCRVALADEAHFNVTDIRIEGDNPLPDAQVKQLLQPYLGEQEGFLGLQTAAEALEELLQQRGYAFHKVVIPPQRTTTGIIVFKVVAYRLDKILVEGNQHFAATSVRASVPPLRSEQTPNSRELARAVELANNHPVRQVGVTVKRSAREGYLDATLKVADRSPQQLFAAINNRGSSSTGETRASLGYQFSNLFNRDHTVTLTYTTSPGHWGDVAQYGANYVVPLYGLAGQLSVFYTYSDVDSGTVAEFFHVSGRGKFGGLQYVQHLLPWGAYRHHVQVSLEDRLFENNVDFRGLPIGSDVRSRPIGLEYGGDWVYPEANYSFQLGYFHNLPGGPSNSGGAYTAARPDAERTWGVFRASAAADHRLPRSWLVRGRLNAQYARAPLIPGEQLGFGGADALRGFDERLVAGDSGAVASLELWAPPLKWGVTMLGFIDSGYGTREKTQPGEKDRLSLTSVGIGGRWRPNDHFTLTFDWGVVTKGEANAQSGDNRLHFNLLVRP